MKSANPILVFNALSDAASVAMKRLRAAGFRIASAERRQFPVTLPSRWTERHFSLGNEAHGAYARDLLRLVREIRPAGLLPMDTRSVWIAAEHAAELSRWTRANLPDLDALRRVVVKSECQRLCRELGIAVPEVYTPAKAEDRLRRGDRKDKLVVKPDLDRGGARGVRYVTDPQALADAIRSCRRYLGPALVQEHIPGGASNMKTVVLLFSRKSRLLAAFTMRKLRHWPLAGGQTALAVSTAEPDLLESVLPLFEFLGWRGPAEVELKLDARDGVHKLIEVNPRFPSYLRFPCSSGLDFPVLAARCVLEQDFMAPLAFPSYRPGLVYLTLGLFARCLVSELLAGRAIADVLGRGARDALACGPTNFEPPFDPLPRIGQVLAMVGLGRPNFELRLRASDPTRSP